MQIKNKSKRTRAFNYGFKISEQGFDVLNPNKNGVNTNLKPDRNNVLYFLAYLYLIGARKQIKRYQIASAKLKQDSINATIDCFHEVSNLFEDLASIAKYLEQSGNKNDIHNTWFSIRHNIRHDIREEFDKVEKRKKLRKEELKIHINLQLNVGFSEDSIKVGETIIEIKQINDYLDWFEAIVINKIFKPKT